MNCYRFIEQLFQGVLDQSTTIEGRFHISHKYGAQEINFDVLSELTQEIPNRKYPLSLMPPPTARSEYDGTLDGEWERYRIIIFFVNASFTQGINEDTKTSIYKVPYDWDDMKQVALSFKAQLHKIQKATGGKIFRIPSNTALIYPVSNVGLDRVSGVKFDFDLDIYTGCNPSADYPTFVIPEL